jgi:hypothetical protein
VLPRKEYRAHVTKINVFFVLPHCSGSLGSSAGTGKSAWPYPVSSPSAARRLTVPGMSSSWAWLGWSPVSVFVPSSWRRCLRQTYAPDASPAG